MRPPAARLRQDARAIEKPQRRSAMRCANVGVYPAAPIKQDIGRKTMAATRITRRTALKSAALASASILAAPYVRTSYAAGKLTLGCWDHWVPGANNTLTKLCSEWGAKNSVDVHIDYITSVGDKDLLTASAEAQARTGHDIMSQRAWQVAVHRRVLEPLDDIVKNLIQKYGPISQVSEYLAKHDGVCRGIPTTVGSQVKPCCSRIDLYNQHCNLNLTQIFPADDNRAALEYLKKLMLFNPKEVYAWDDAGNNRWLITGKGSSIMNPPSAWSVAKKDNPKVAENCWTHDMPRGPKGRYVGQLPFFYSVWS